MECLKCKCIESDVVDSRQADDGRTRKRRRLCQGCGCKYTTIEIPVLVFHDLIAEHAASRVRKIEGTLIKVLRTIKSFPKREGKYSREFK